MLLQGGGLSGPSTCHQLATAENFPVAEHKQSRHEKALPQCAGNQPNEKSYRRSQLGLRLDDAEFFQSYEKLQG